MSRNFATDESLVDQLLLDDTSAFEELHHRYCFSLYSYCMGKLKSHEDAKHIVRDIFIALWENRHHLPVGYSVSLHFYTEVRKAVVKCVNEKLRDNNEAELIGQEVIPGFSVSQLQKARQPVLQQKPQPRSICQPPAAQKEYYENQWWIPSINLRGLKHALQHMLNFW